MPQEFDCEGLQVELENAIDKAINVLGLFFERSAGKRNELGHSRAGISEYEIKNVMTPIMVEKEFSPYLLTYVRHYNLLPREFRECFDVKSRKLNDILNYANDIMREEIIGNLALGGQR